MEEESDVQLLLRYTGGDEAAFGEIVERHGHLVYSAALRQIGSAERASDVAQTVFIDLARKARVLGKKFPAKASIVGWLYRSTRLASLAELRTSRRRLAAESKLMTEVIPSDATTEPEVAWERLKPLLDETISELKDEDQNALLLRFFKNQDFRAVGVALGISYDAAHKRVTRALERLRKLLVRRGATISPAALAAVISAQGVEAAPPAVMAVLAGTAIGSASIVPAGSGAMMAGKFFTMTTLQKGVLGVFVLAAVGTGFHEFRRANQLDAQLKSVRQEQQTLADKFRQLQERSEKNARELGGLLAENDRLRRDASDVLKLRAEIGRLRNQSKADGFGAADETDVAAQNWANRVKALKARFAGWPGKATPELQLLTEQNWLDVAAAHEMGSDEDCRAAMSELRLKGKEKFSEAINQALKQFEAQNNQQLPVDLSELSPFLDPTASACLQGWDVAKPGWVKPPKPSGTQGETAAVWALVEKGSFTPEGVPIRDGSYVADPEYDMTIIIYNGGCFGYGPDRRSN